MRRFGPWSALLFLFACDPGAVPGPALADFSFARPPALVSRQGAVPPLPQTGRVGIGALLYPGESAPHLVLTTGEHLRLPSPPSGEGRNGTMIATLSPDGRWLGHRKAEHVGDTRYLLRDLRGEHPTMEVQGLPLMWSPEGRFLLMSGATDGTAHQLIEPAVGKASPVPQTGGVGGLLPGGTLLFTQPREDGPRQLRLSGAGKDVTIAFAAAPDHECWCPSSYRVSPDGTTIAALLVYQNGLIPGTEEKSRPRSGAQAAVYELATGKLLHRIELPDPSGSLLADTGKGLLLQRNGPGQADAELLLWDPATGRQDTLSRLTNLHRFTVAGGILQDGV